MTVALRKGWCPGALRPMAARDGLLVRLRITGGILSARTAHAIAELAARHGNGRMELSARGNLQMRGVAEASLPLLWTSLDALDLLDEDAAAESIRNVMASPLAGLHDGPDIRPLVEALEDRLTQDERLRALPTKFGFLIDDGSSPSLAGVTADLRFDWIAERGAFAIGLGGARHDSTWIGHCAALDLVDVADRLAREAIRLFAGRPDARRMRSLLPHIDVRAMAKAAGVDPASGPPHHSPATAITELVGRRGWKGVETLGLAAPFGSLTSRMLADAAEIASRGGIRLTPWRVLLVPVGPDEAVRPPTGFIINPADPRLAVAACVGKVGCERATTPTRQDASVLAELATTLGGALPLHVSGCEKGCAKPSVSAVTLVGRDGRYDLVRDGRASDTPDMRGLTLAAARHAIHTMGAKT